MKHSHADQAGTLASENDEAGHRANGETGPWDQTTHLHSAELATRDQAKRFETIRAQLALKGYCLSQTEAGYLITRWARRRLSMTRPIDAVLARLDKPKPSGRDRWRSACPACRGHRAALSISRAGNGAALPRCGQGCSIERITAALGLGVEDLFPLRGSERPWASRTGGLQRATLA